MLPAKTKLFRLNLSSTPLCEMCSHNVNEDITHAVLECDFNSNVNDWILAVLIDIDPDILNSDLTSINIVTLNLEVQHEKKLAFLIFLVTAFKLIWNLRKQKKPIILTQLKSLTEAELTILMKTKFSLTAKMIETALNFNA